MEAKGDPHYPLRPENANVDGPMRESIVSRSNLDYIKSQKMIRNTGLFAVYAQTKKLNWL